ncbi:MAG TPA: nitrilase-related carbon-nitrogen hydrolase, partial [Puia sp.]|nr:nitrilase-related carbon-nitrogen hydrolase [Puia sp.]
MDKIKISTVQFENASGNKKFNLSEIEELAAGAAASGSKVVAFHECSITGYSFARHLSKDELLDISEAIPTGESVKALSRIAAKLNLVLLAGLFEKDEDDRIYNTYVCVDKKGLVAKHRKLHPFISHHLSPGNSYCVFDILGWRCGILICYDNNVIENVRATNLLG